MKKQTFTSQKAFTIIELIFVIVIIGVLASVALPKFRGLSSGAKISAEIATMSSVVTALETVNGEWSINEGSFKWGTGKENSSLLNTNGYPEDLNNSNSTFGRIIKDSSNEYILQNKTAIFSIFTGPASNTTNGVSFSSTEPDNKPDKNDFWVYGHSVVGSFTCKGKIIYPGDFVLIDNSGNTQDYTCN